MAFLLRQEADIEVERVDIYDFFLGNDFEFGSFLF